MLKMANTSPHALSYDEAWLYCATCTHDNKYDWRLPTLRNIYGWTEDSEYNGKIQAYPVRNYMIEQAEKNKKKFLYDDAWLYCATLTQDNKYNWRIPTFNECSKYNMDSHWDTRPSESYAYRGVAWYITPVRDL